MKFRTDIDIAPSGFRIDHSLRGFIAGSCFSEHIYSRLVERKFPVCANPTGILFNPFSIAAMLRRLAEDRPYRAEDLETSGGLWFSYDHHGSFSGGSASEVLDAINEALEVGERSLSRADYVILTFGTAWIYRLAADGRVVANCHKRPASDFIRERLGVEEITDEYAALLKGPLAGKQVLLTVSPVRHIKDGLAGNSFSKAVLRCAAGKLEESFAQVHYFPSFEILNDDLRDYRFYAEDMVHPSEQAVDYIWEMFTAFSMDSSTLALLPVLDRLRASVRHRILNPGSDESRRFASGALALVEELGKKLPSADFGAEREHFREILSGVPVGR